MDAPADIQPTPHAEHAEAPWLVHLYRQREWDVLVGASQRALFERPDDDLARLLLATAYAQTGRFDDAYHRFDELVDTEWTGQVWLHRAYTSQETDLHVAAAWLDKHRLAYPQDPASAWRDGALARVQLRLGRVQAARAVLGSELPARIPKRHPWAGALSSAVVPGLGQLISGRPVEAVSALTVVGGLAAGTVWAISEERAGTAVVIGAVGGLFWAGNVYGGADSAVQWNRAQVASVVAGLDAAGVPGAGPPPLP